jgi:hypothetical protein
MRALRLVIVVNLLAVMVSACGGDSTVKLNRVDLSRDVRDDGRHIEPRDLTTTFKPGDAVHALVTIGGAANAPRVKVAWTAMNAGDARDKLLREDEQMVDSDHDVVHASLRAGSGPNLPAGDYKIDVFLNNALERTVAFQVRE